MTKIDLEDVYALALLETTTIVQLVWTHLYGWHEVRDVLLLAAMLLPFERYTRLRILPPVKAWFGSEKAAPKTEVSD